jgi:hypothetical protein
MHIPRNWSLLALMMAAFLLLASFAMAQSAATTREGKGKSTVTVRPPTPAERQMLSKKMGMLVSEEDKDLVIVQHKNGMQSVDLQGRFQNIAVVKKNVDGTVAGSCADSANSAAEFTKSKMAKKANTAEVK